ncbi:uncharacterized protein LOC113122424 [Mastacembelus armatus]|uniref:uncharacterized protein LOC113122424 n=1 Tax=Mastacembelus armatus TaxID=205130 RepID=UPI000E458EF8|nr:uncharacterized protein LOC113122424 [Mastacembelus armatus]XP_026149564.1 uncharacterized protein LOC113122424 [Mastacembelus armatus]XP_026149571.1 uncharacterized protein LOC113122424 [Mastacembelus armatus]
MMNFTLAAALLCALSVISVSVSEFHTVEVQPGEEVTLLCTNFTRFPSHITWFRLGNGSNTSCIATMRSSETSAVPCDGPQNLKFNMTSNTSTLFLTIRPVDLSDSGLYFCGFYMGVNGEHKVTVSATYLKVQEVLSGLIDLRTAILGGLVIFLFIVIIIMVVKIRKPYTAHEEKNNPQLSDDLNYAALSFHPGANRSRRPVAETELNSNAVYAATR